MSAVYGGEHLLRLFGTLAAAPGAHCVARESLTRRLAATVKLPMLLAQTNIAEGAMQRLAEQLQHVLTFMLKHAPRLFMREYDNATPDYCRVANS